MGWLSVANQFLHDNEIVIKVYQTNTDFQGLNDNIIDYTVVGHVMFVKSKDNRMEERDAGKIDETEGTIDFDWLRWVDAGLGDINTGALLVDLLRNKSKHRLEFNGQTYKLNNVLKLDTHAGRPNVVRVIFEKLQKETGGINV